MDKTKTEAKEQGQRTQFCSCRNSCQKGTGKKRKGCPCKDEALYCSDQCKCGTNVIVCKNSEHECHIKTDTVNSRKSSTETELVSDLSNMLVTDESDSPISDNVKPDTPNTRPAKGQDKGRTQKVLSQSLLHRVHQINNGYALVIHNIQFTKDNKTEKREGSQKDLDEIKIFCTEAGLTLDIQENLKVNAIRTHCRKLTDDENRFQNYDGFVCFILSHGNSSGICGKYGDVISVQEIVTYFKESDDLLGKPKLFFIQACRSDGVEDDGNEVDQKNRLCPPDSSDILIAHSTIDGELSYRDIRTGSWFIQTLMKQFKAHSESLHLMDIMTTVNDDIAGSELEGKRQMPIQVSTLTKFVYFKMATVAKVMQAPTNMFKDADDGESSCMVM